MLRAAKEAGPCTPGPEAPGRVSNGGGLAQALLGGLL